MFDISNSHDSCGYDFKTFAFSLRILIYSFIRYKHLKLRYFNYGGIRKIKLRPSGRAPKLLDAGQNASPGVS